MRFCIQIIVIALLAYLLELFLPWWSIAIAAALGGYLFKSRANLLAGFLSIGLLWLIAAWRIDVGSPAHLADKIAAIMKMSKHMLMAVTSILGGLVGGFAALTGSLARPSKRSRH